MFNEKDICLIIPTINRAKDVDRTLSILIKNENIIGKILIIDQSKNNLTKEIVSKYKKKLPVEYIFSTIPSSSIAENIGVKEAKRRGFKLILISGDDVDFFPNYTQNIVKEFNDNPKLMGLGGVDIESGAARHHYRSRIVNFILKLFFLPAVESNKFRVIGPYGFTSSSEIKKSIKDAQWIPGFNNCFRTEVYNNYNFPEIIGYNVLEDIDCSYAVYKKYGSGSLLITPKCKVWHRESKVARYPDRKRIFVNHEDHFAFYYRHFNTHLGTMKLVWSLIGIILGNIIRVIIHPAKETLTIVKNNIEGIICAYKNRRKIQQGKFRAFLNYDLSLKE